MSYVDMISAIETNLPRVKSHLEYISEEWLHDSSADECFIIHIYIEDVRPDDTNVTYGEDKMTLYLQTKCKPTSEEIAEYDLQLDEEGYAHFDKNQLATQISHMKEVLDELMDYLGFDAGEDYGDELRYSAFVERR